jgi:prepilin-type N-terminal cleavage/methylation domain-containing protein
MRTHNITYVNHLGFTLIELLVVITIIWILSVWSVTVYTSQIQKSRDATRVTDLSSLRAGIEQFYNDKYVYPQGVAEWISPDDTTATTTTVQEFSPTLAQDPKWGQTCIGSPCDYAYKVTEDKNGILKWAYELSTAFENQWNLDSKARNSADNWNDTNRLEIWLLMSKIVTSFLDNSATSDLDQKLTWSDTTAFIIIRKDGIYEAPLGGSEVNDPS